MGKVIKWTEEELKILRENYPYKGKEEMENLLPNRNYMGIRIKANKLGIKKFEIEERDGYKHCKKCGRELPYDYYHFPEDKTMTFGLRNVCRECNPSYGRFLTEKFERFTWTKEDEDLLRKVYPNYTSNEIIYMFFRNLDSKSIRDKAWSLGCNGKNTYAAQRGHMEQAKSISGENNPNYGKPMSLESKEKLSNSLKEYYKTHVSPVKGIKLSKERCLQLSERMKKEGRWKGNNNPRHINPLEGDKNGKWKGGITPIYLELRTQINEWKKESMKACNYECVITDGKFDEIHHVNNTFKNIILEAFENINLPIKTHVKDYTTEEFALIVEEVRRLHVKYGTGVCLNKHIHKLFHNTYGYSNNTKSQFDDFVNKLKCGVFDEFLLEHNLTLRL